MDWKNQRNRKIFPEANIPERLGSQLNDPSLYQSLFYRDLFNKRKIKELIDIWLTIGNPVSGTVGDCCGCDRRQQAGTHGIEGFVGQPTRQYGVPLVLSVSVLALKKEQDEHCS